MHYQPIVPMRRDAQIGLEALVRWRHPERGLITSQDFVGAAERSGTIMPVSEWVIAEAARQYAVWMSNGHEFDRIAINVARAQLMGADFADRARRAV